MGWSFFALSLWYFVVCCLLESLFVIKKQINCVKENPCAGKCHLVVMKCLE